MRIFKTRIAAFIIAIVFCAVSVAAFAACEPAPAPAPPPAHECADKCPTCNKCTTDCTDPACAEKCEGHEPIVHECADKCPTCGKCTTDCDDPICAEKCEGHEPIVHECADKCPTCNKCTTDCTDPACAEKCEGHEPPAHECADKCPTCNKCTTDCDDPICAEKCEGHEHSVTFDLDGGDGDVSDTVCVFGGKFDLPLADGLTKEACDFVGWNDGTTTYNAGDEYTMPDADVEFVAVWREYPSYAFDIVTDGVQNENVSLKRGTGGFIFNSDHIGGVAKNENAMLIFDVSADKAGGALLYFTVCDRLGTFTFDDAYSLNVNGADIPSDTDMSQTDSRWEVFNSYLIASVDLLQGKNRIIVTVLPTGDLDLAGNVRGITLRSNTVVCTPYVLPDKNWTHETELNALTDGTLSAGVKTNGTVSAGENCIGAMQYVDNYVTFDVVSETDCTAALWLNACHRPSGYFCDAFELYIDNVKIDCYTEMPTGGTEWTDFDYVRLCGIKDTIEMKAGEPVCILIRCKGYAYNIRGIKLVTETETDISFASDAYSHTSDWNSTDIAFATDSAVAQGIRTEGGVGKDGACAALGNIAGNANAKIGFTLNSDAASRAVIYLDASEHGKYFFDQAFELKVNGKKVDSCVFMPGGNAWMVFRKTAIAEIELVEGDNEITIEVISSDGDRACNLAGVTVRSENSAVSLVI